MSKMVDVYKLSRMMLTLLLLLCKISVLVSGHNFEIPVKNIREYTKVSYSIPDSCFPEPDVCRNASELIRSKGYPCEDHTVQTEDGYLLGVQRIPHGIHGHNSPTPRPVVFLQHGLLSSSADWVNNLVNESFAYLLADAGFDVWLGNLRGNTYSRHHVSLDPSQDKFWAFSWDQMAKYDLPAMIDYALKISSQSQLYYVGHSQGTIIGFAHFSQDQELAKKIKAFFAFGPVATTGHIKSPLWVLSYLTPEIQDLFNIFGIKEFLPKSEIIKILGQTVCTDSWTRIACENLIFLICGYDYSQFNATRIPVYVSHTPAGTSVQNVVHFAQMVRSDKFQMYDYGCPEKNVQHYGQKNPPEYDPTKVEVPVYLISGENDWLADPKDVHFLEEKLPNIKMNRQIPSWQHLDFLWGMDAPHVLYRPVIKVMKDLEHN